MDRLSSTRGYHKSESLGVVVTLIEEHFFSLDHDLSHLGLGDDVSSVDLDHLLTLLVTADESKLIVAFESRFLVSELADEDEGSTRSGDSELELRPVSHRSLGSNKVALLSRLIPAFSLSEDTASVEVLEVLQQVSRVHPEDTVRVKVFTHIRRGVIQALNGFVSPLVRVISPIASPFQSIISRSVGISELKQDFSIVFLDLQDGISVVHDDTSAVAILVSSCRLS